MAGRLLEVYYDTDIRALLPVIQARTAVLHREADSATPFELGREVATLIPGAALIPLPGTGHLFYQGEWEPVLDGGARLPRRGAAASGRGSPAASSRWPG